jgi:amicyanin
MNIHKVLQATSLVALISLSGILFSACQSASTQTAPTTSQTAPTTDSASQKSIAIQNMEYANKDIQVKVGETVTWTNKDLVGHTVTSDSGAFESGNINKDQSFSFTFTSEGTFPYHCAPHPWMKGKVTVTK